MDESPITFTTDDLSDFAALERIGACMDHIQNTISSWDPNQHQQKGGDNQTEETGEITIADGLGYISQQEQERQQHYHDQPTSSLPSSSSSSSNSTHSSRQHVSDHSNSTDRHYMRQLNPPYFPPGVPRLNK